MPICTFMNNWGGRRQDHLIRYIERQASFCDVIACSEVDHIDGDEGKSYRNVTVDDGEIMVNQFAVLQHRLDHAFVCQFDAENENEHTCLVSGRVENVAYGNAFLISRRVKVVTRGAEYIFPAGRTYHRNPITPRKLQYVIFDSKGERYLVAHFHGIWLKDNTKGDAPERIIQSQNVNALIEELTKEYNVQKVILGGDFNLDINTEALALLESSRINRNLIREYGVTDGRTRYYRNYGVPGHSLYASYILTSPEVVTHRFIWSEQNVSDHRPLQIECQ